MTTTMSAEEEEVKQTLKLPSWLKSELFDKILSENVSNYRKTINFKAMPGTKPGENYATTMLRLEIDVELNDDSKQTISYMLKIPLISDFYTDLLGKTDLFDVERSMYMDYVREFEKMYRDVGLELKFGAQSYDLHIDTQYVLLEDLRPKGFQTTKRQDCLDMEHTQGVLKKLAQWHAASAVRIETKGKYPEKHSSGLLTEHNKKFMRSLTENLVPYILDTISTFEGHEAYYNDVANLATTELSALYRIAETDPNEFNVLNHGDCWLSNVMFKYDEYGKIMETYLVDYQVPFYGSLAFDLLYFLVSSPKLDIKLNKFDYFIYYYHKQLIEHLQILKYPKKLPTLKDVHYTLIKYGIWGYATATGVMAGVLVEPSDNAKFDNVFAETEEGKDFKKSFFSGKLYKEHLKLILPWLQNRGALKC